MNLMQFDSLLIGQNVKKFYAKNSLRKSKKNVRAEGPVRENCLTR